MKNSLSYAIRWKWVALPAIAMLFLSILPQLHLWFVRGRDWNGAYVSSQGDEFIYSAYINALIDGRARKNDPFAGRDSTSKVPLPESTLSIQFIPPYVISSLARFFHASASTAFICLVCITGLTASLSIYFLLNAVLDSPSLAAAGTLFVLCLGGLAGGEGLYPTLPFLRRFQPAAAFPLFFVFNMVVWYSITSATKRRSLLLAGLGGVILAVLIFSYLYLWTAAAAWLACISFSWLLFRPLDRRKVVMTVCTISVISISALVPYLHLLSQRGPGMDEEQALAATHRFDLFRIPEILAFFVFVALAIGVWRGTIQKDQPRTLYTASLAMVSFVLFNQQVLTGRSMQPHHFAIFIANYAVLLGVFLLATLLWKSLSPRMLVWIAALSFSWGLVQVALPSRLATVPSAVRHDEMVPMLLHLKELAKQDGTFSGLQAEGQAGARVFSPDIGMMLILPTWTAQGTLLDMRGLDFGSVSSENRRQFLYMHLYFSNMNAEFFRRALKGETDDAEVNFYARSAIFSYDRVLPFLSNNPKPIRDPDIEQQVQIYQTYENSFSRNEALKRPIAYALLSGKKNFDFTNLDRWYERDAGERVGDYTLFRLKLRG